MTDFAAWGFGVADAVAFGAGRRSDMAEIMGKKSAPRAILIFMVSFEVNRRTVARLAPGTNLLAQRAGRRLGFRIGFSNRLARESNLDELLSHESGWPTVVSEAGDERPPLGRLLAILWVRGGLRDMAQLGVRGTSASIGRDPGNDVVLDAPAVAARHAELSLARGVWTLTDLDSTNGSWVDGVRVEGSLALAPGSEIQLGDVVLAFAPRDEWSDSPRQQATVAAVPASSRPLFLLPEETAGPSSRLLTRTAIVLGVCLLAYILLAAR